MNLTIYFYKTDDAYGCFSNFSFHGITIDGENWLTVEHYYQAQKFVGTNFDYLIPEIKAAPLAQEAAKIGRDPKYSYRLDWDQIKVEIMYRGVKEKFLTHLDIQQVLLATGDREIVEDSPIDYFWGCGLDRTGKNHLGKILMRVRNELRS